MKLFVPILSKEKSNYQDIDHHCPSYSICSGMYPRCLYTPLYLCSYADPLGIRRYLKYIVFALEIKPCVKRTQHCWPTTPDIVGCYMLRAFACCCVLLGVVAQIKV